MFGITGVPQVDSAMQIAEQQGGGGNGGDWIEGAKETLGGIIDLGKEVSEGIGELGGIFGGGNESQEQTRPKPGQSNNEPGSYDMNLKLSDFKFSPDVRLLAIGAALLALAMILKK